MSRDPDKINRIEGLFREEGEEKTKKSRFFWSCGLIIVVAAAGWIWAGFEWAELSQANAKISRLEKMLPLTHNQWTHLRGIVAEIDRITTVSRRKAWANVRRETHVRSIDDLTHGTYRKALVTLQDTLKNAPKKKTPKEPSR